MFYNLIRGIPTTAVGFRGCSSRFAVFLTLSQNSVFGRLTIDLAVAQSSSGCEPQKDYVLYASAVPGVDWAAPTAVAACTLCRGSFPPATTSHTCVRHVAGRSPARLRPLRQLSSRPRRSQPRPVPVRAVVKDCIGNKNSARSLQKRCV